ncbi:frizzled-4-like [Centruroides vittatus]|uniref:frizzled-4-like n=1 Tax=Centruroides vittatus TaxID=120091 RepID=UPI0035108128
MAPMCEPIQIEMCKDLGFYNVTRMPNILGDRRQYDAHLELAMWKSLIAYGCSSRLSFFLCSVYVPMCSDMVPQNIGPCAPLCEDVKARCFPVMEKFGFRWPIALECSKFPTENNDVHMCMKGPDPTGEDHHQLHSYGWRRFTDRGVNVPTKPTKPYRHRYSQHYGLCNKYKVESFYYINGTGRCTQTCDSEVLFSRVNKNFAEIWATVWSVLCFLSTLFTVSTFLINSSKFHYRERPIVIISGMYNVYSIAYIIRLMAGWKEVSCHVDSQHGVPILIQESLDNINCTIIFVFLYFFRMASDVWWVILTIMWFLSVGLKWNNEAMQRRRIYFQMFGWSFPTLKTIAILLLRVVDADELTGTCYVGNQSPQNLLGFVIVPSFVYLIIGSIFLLTTLYYILKSKYSPALHTHHRNNCCRVEKLDILTARIGIFAVFYIVPALCVLTANFYEYYSRDKWLAAGSNSRPNVDVFMLKIFMSFVVGISTGPWICWSKNALNTWKEFYNRFNGNERPMSMYIHESGEETTVQKTSSV